MSSRSSSHSSVHRASDSLLPVANGAEKPALRVASLLSHGIYRRVLMWSVAILVLISIVLYGTREGGLHRMPNSINKPDQAAEIPKSPERISTPATSPNDSGFKNQPDTETVSDVNIAPADAVGKDKEDTEQSQKEWKENQKRMPWLKFKHLDGYYNGIKTLVSPKDHTLEDSEASTKDTYKPPPRTEEHPKPRPYHPYNSSQPDFHNCYLDGANKVPVPDIYAFNGIPQHHPEPALGSNRILEISDDVCFDRFGRYGPYGFGYGKRLGGSGIGYFTEHSGSEEVWAKSGKIDYSQVDWALAQDRCYESNKARFHQLDPQTNQLIRTEGKTTRTAIVIRVYTGFKWTDMAIVNFRALISELSLKSGGEYHVHFLLHVKDSQAPIWSDDTTVRHIVEKNIPAEFRGLVSVWSEPQMKLYYPAKFREAYSNPSGKEMGGVYRSAHWALQIFAMRHAEYDHFWNWEMDMRYTGNYYELFNRMEKFAKKQSRHMLWEQSARYFIPTYHETWDNFTSTVERDIQESGKDPTFGPVTFQGRKSLRTELLGDSMMPETCDPATSTKVCGVGEEADLITLNPIFDTDQSGWVFGLDASGYNKKVPPPRRAAIITASRISRRLLMAMHEEVWRNHHNMFSEMFPASVAFHHGFKAVYAPHPVYLDRFWNATQLDNVFNGGKDHSTSAGGSPFDIAHEHNHGGSTWYFNSKFSGLLWRRWLGYPQRDLRGKYQGTRGNDGVMRGGKNEEESPTGTGRMCLRPILLHPIKFEHPSEQDEN